MFSAFTFRFPVPFNNPFSAPQIPEQNGVNHDSLTRNDLRSLPHNHPGPRLSPVPSISSVRQDLKRPRAWEPSTHSNSQASTTFAQTSGYLDTPAKYRDLAASVDECAMLDMRQSIEPSDLPEPPTKRRRGLAGSIVSTAVSAALIGSAVGLTVYRLWRNKGKETTHAIAPPPPYQEQDTWPSPQQSSSSDPKVAITPPTPHGRFRKGRHTYAYTHSPNGSSRRRRRARPHGTAPSPGSQQPYLAPSQPEFQFGSMQMDSQDDGEADHQMDALSSKMSYLIEQGRKALGAEVVVDSEAQEDEVDDGDENWIDEEESPSKRHRRNRSGSVRRSQRSTPGHSLPPSPHVPQFPFGQTVPISIPRSTTEFGSLNNGTPSRQSSFHPPSSFPAGGFPVTPSPGTSLKEDTNDWGSDAIRESMERARARAREAQLRQ